MTTEEKARAYDEALSRASKLRVQNPFDTISQMMEHVFPELKESEDEMIRKAIINTIEDCSPILSPEVQKRMIAWIEKQIPKPKWSENDEEELEIAIETLHEAGQHSSANWLKSLKKRMEE